MGKTKISGNDYFQSYETKIYQFYSYMLHSKYPRNLVPIKFAVLAQWYNMYHQFKLRGREFSFSNGVSKFFAFFPLVFIYISKFSKS